MALDLFGAATPRSVIKDDTVTGLYMSRLSMQATEEVSELEDHRGSVIGVALGSQKCTIEGEGFVVAADTQTQTLGSAMGSLAGAGIYGKSVVTTFLITDMGFERASKTYQTGSFTARGWEDMDDGSGDPVS